MKTLKNQKLAMITGVTGQDGSYLADLLLDKGYNVIGLHRRSSGPNFSRLGSALSHPDFSMIEFDLTDPFGVVQIISKYQPDEFYNLAAQSHVATSFNQPTTTVEINTVGVINLLEAIRRYSTHTKFYQASTSEMFGRNVSVDPETNETYQDENTEFMPQSPYGVSKLASHRMVQIYKEAYGIFACSGILFNHESPRRGTNFVTRKITKYIGSLQTNSTQETLKLGNLQASRDWGHAKDYVRAMWMMLQHDIPEDFVIASGTTHTVLDFIKQAFEYVDLDYKQYIEIDPVLYRPAEVEYLRGRPDKAKSILGWDLEISFEDLVKDMVSHDINTAKTYV